MGLKDDLIAAKALIADPAKWRKDSSDAYPDACCAIVAGNRAVGKKYVHYPIAYKLAEALPEAWLEEAQLRSRYRASDEPGMFVGDYNDDPDTTHADIMALFDRAINAAEAS